MSLMGLALVTVLIVLGARWLYARTPKQRERRLMRKLVEACHGDHELAERLMLGELNREPALSLGAAADRAHKRLQRDRGR